MDEPTSLRAGDSVSWTVNLPEYPASAGWSLKYRLLAPRGVSKDIDATASGDGYAIQLTSADTAAFPAGTATLVKIVTKGAERVTLAAPQVQILPDLGALGNHDGRSLNQRALDDLEAALAAYAAAGQGHVAEYEIAGRRMKFRDVDQIERLIAHYRREVAKERGLRALLNGEQPPGRCYYRG